MDTELLTIAAVSEQTGIGIETLRAWERRYGQPKPVRLPSGHRRYTREQTAWLKRVADAVAHGHRPSQVLNRSERELDRLLNADGRCVEKETAAERRLLDLARRFDETQLVKSLESDASRLGPDRFVLHRVLPLLTVIGRQWSAGKLGIRHEHFLCEILEDLLRELRRAAAPDEGAPLVLLTTISGEHHHLGLQAAALLLVSSGLRVRLLGPDTPNEEILAAVRETDAAAVALSVSLATCGVYTERRIGDLRANLAPRVRLIAGGQGARRLRRGVRGVDYFPDLEEFKTWLDTQPLISTKAG